MLDWFEARLAPSGLLGRIEWWNYADWVDSFPNGEPPMLETGESAILTLQFVLALREAADLEAAFGSASQAARVSCPRRQDGRRRRGLVLGREEGSARRHAGPYELEPAREPARRPGQRVAGRHEPA